LCAFLFACGKAAPTSTPTPCQISSVDGPGPGDVTELFPLSGTNRWFYDQSFAGSGLFGSEQGSARSQVDITQTRVVDGASVTVFATSDLGKADDPIARPTEELYRVGSAGLAMITTFGSPQTFALLLLPFPPVPGTSFVPLTCSGLKMPDESRLDFDSSATVVGNEQVNLPGGSFNATRVDWRARLTVRQPSGSIINVKEHTESNWYAEHTGMVKRSMRTDDYLGWSTFSQLLSGYSVGDRRAGLNRLVRLTYGIGLPLYRAAETRAALSFDGTRSLLAFARSGYWYSPHEETTIGDSLVGSFIGADGSTSPPFNISTTVGDTVRAGAAFNGTNHLVAGSLCPNRGIQCDTVFGQRVSATGQLLDGAAGFTIQSGGGHVFTPAVASDGVGWFVVYADDAAGVKVARISATGQLLGILTLGTAAVQGEGAPLGIASGGSVYFVVWLEGSELRGVRVMSDGTVLDPTPVPISTTQSAKELGGVAFDGNQFLVVWGDERLNSTPSLQNIFAARVSRAGVLLDGPPESGGILINAYPGVAKREPAVAFDGARFVVSWWIDQLGIYATPVTRDGIPDHSPTEIGMVVADRMVSGRWMEHPAVVAQRNGEVLVAWFELTRFIEAAWLAPVH